MKSKEELHYEKCAYIALLLDVVAFFILGGICSVIAIVMAVTACRSKQTPVRVIAGVAIAIAVVWLILIAMSLTV